MNLNYVNRRENSVGSIEQPWYISKMVKRFVTGQYAEGLPVGCRLGYVLDGDMSFAQGRVHAAITANKDAIAVTNEADSSSRIAFVERFTIDHIRKGSGELIHVRHSLLPFPTQVKPKTKQTGTGDDDITSS